MEFNEKELEECLQVHQDSDSTMVTASEGYTSSCSPNSANSNPSEVSSSKCLSLESVSLQDLNQGQESSQDDLVISNEDRDSYGKRGDADGCSLSNSDEPNVKIIGEAQEAEVNNILEAQLKELVITQEPDIEGESDANSIECPCKRPVTNLYEENSLAIQGAWNELRSAIRQLYRRVVPSQNKSLNHSSCSRPSINRIRALSNMLFNHDPHQLFNRASQLSQEFCIELKVRLLATIHDSPDLDEASSFIQGLCETYQWVMNACEAIQGAFEKLDAEHLSLFGLNWMTVNMHTFYTSIFTDLDVQDYLNICTAKAGETTLGEEAIGCLASLKRTLTVSESIWQRAESHLQEYAMERTALNVQRRQLLADWGSHSKNHTSLGKYFLHKHLNANSNNGCAASLLINRDSEECKDSNLSSYAENPAHNCQCSSCLLDHDSNQKEFSSTLFHNDFSGKRSNSPSGCECHFCNNSSLPQLTNSMLSTSGGGALPPLTQPQLSLYPHIHGTGIAVSDIVPSSPSLDDLGPIPGSASNSKPPIFSNPYLGSDLLTEQLIREWDSAYGDTLSLPGSTSITSIANGSIDTQSNLVNGLDNLCVASRPSYANQMVDHKLPFIPDAVSIASAQTSIVSANEAPNYKPVHSCPSSSTSLSSSLQSSTSVAIPTSTPLSRSSLTPPSVAGDWQRNNLAAHDHSSSCKGIPCAMQSHNGESVITHTKSYQGGTSLHKGFPSDSTKYSNGSDPTRSEENSTSRETPSESETSGHDEWSSADESDSSAISSHEDSHCDCCYCHMLQSKPGGRQKYSDRRERLLKVLSKKKKANPSSSSSSNTSTAAYGSSVMKSSVGGENALGQQTLDEILSFIEGRHCNESSHAKKAAKKARQKEKKLAALRRKHISAKCEKEKSTLHDEDFDDDLEQEEDFDEDEEEEEEEEEDGPLAELRRRAPDVTITVVKPGQKQAAQLARTPQTSLTRDSSNLPTEPSKHPLASKPMDGPNALGKEAWGSHPHQRAPLSSGSFGSMRGFQGGAMHPPPPMGESTAGKFQSSAPPVGLSNLLKDMEVSGKEKDQDSEAKSSQMVTIRRVMDPVSAEPTVTITLKGEESEKDKVLFKLVNGQGTSSGGKDQPTPKVKQKAPPQVKPVYNIPPGTSPEEAKKMKKQQKKDRQRFRKEQDRLEEEKQEQMQQLQLKKQQEFLKQQEKHIKQQQAALQRQQEELLKKKQGQNVQGKKKGKKGKKGKNNSESISIVGYENDDVSRNFNLPPGVSISKVAGQPGMVTISNNMSGDFAQPFLPNPSLYRSSVLPGYQGNPTPGYNVGSSQMRYPGMYGGDCSSMPWNSSIDPCSGSPEESVIVVDTKPGGVMNQVSVKSKANPQSINTTTKVKTAKPIIKMKSKKAFEKLSSEEKIEAAVKGEVDTSWLNQTQKKKYKKALKAIREDKEKAIAKQREEDDLMDQMYQIAKGQMSRQEKPSNNTVKAPKGSDQLDKNKSNQKKKPTQQLENNRSNKNKPKDQQPQQSANTNSNNKKTNSKQKSTSSQPSLVSQKQVTSQKQATQPSKNSFQQPNHLPSKSNTQKNSQKQAPPSQSGQKNSGQQKLLTQSVSQKQQSLPQKVSQKQNASTPQQKQTAQSKGQHTQIKTANIQTKQQNNLPKVSTSQKQQVPTNKQASHKQPTQNKQNVHNIHQGAANLHSQSNTKANQDKHNVHQQGIQKQSNVKQNKASPMMQKCTNFRNMVDRKHSFPDGKSAVNYASTLGYSNDIGHEARYAQYLVANANALGVESNYKSNILNHDDERPELSKKGKKKGKVLEDLTTIDSVFTPKDVTGGELDETEREVEAFKRFCLYNVPRNTGEKPKVNFNVKDILFKNRHGGI